MKSRIVIGTALLVLIITTLAGAGLAQDRKSLREKLIERRQQERSIPSASEPPRISRPGTHRFHFTHDGLRREYIVHVPARRAAGSPPVLLALHGGGGNMDYQAKNYGLVEKSEQAGFVVVFPNGYSRFPGGNFATWNAGKCCGQARDRKIDDVGFLSEVIRRVQIQVNADRDRLFVTGMSNGGLMAYRLACELSGRIRGIAPVAGTDNTIACSPRNPVPVIHFHAKDDTHVLFNGGAGKDAFRRRDQVTEFTSVPATIAKWVAINRAGPARRVLSVQGAACDLHPAGPRGAPVQLCVTDTGGHSWPGVPNRRKQPSMAISANDRMWDFFLSL